MKTTNSARVGRHANAREDRDGDGDAHGARGPLDGDDYVAGAGRRADTRTVRAVSWTIADYYRAAARDDGAAVCALLAKPVATAIVEQDALQMPRTRPAGPADCSRVVSAELKRSFAWSRAQAAAVRVLTVRVDGSEGVVIESLASMTRQVGVTREGDKWQLDSLYESIVR